MGKIIYLKQEIKLGEIITYKGLEIEVTQTLIDNNPDIFKVIDERQELLDKAKRDYPVGTMFESWYLKDKHNMIPKNSTLKWESNVIMVVTDEFPLGMVTLYKDGRWAEVLPLKFITEDGVKIYGDMKTWMVYPKDSDDIRFSHGTWDGNSVYKGYKYFYHKENVLAYIEKHKEKTLEDYENILFERGNSMIYSSGVTYFSVYGWLKDNEPKLYYTKILQLIADDLNDGWVADFNNDKPKWFIIDGASDCIIQHDYGIVPFKTKEIAEKVIDILGDKVKYLFNKNI